MKDEMQWRESIEWQNIWWERANDISIKRIALLGDSVTRAYRSKLNERLEGKYVVDLCASSSQITDSLLWREYKFFLDCSEWKYDKIVLQTGGQHGHTRRCCDSKEVSLAFESKYKELVEKMISYCSDILIVSSTPCVEEDELTKWNDYRNEELRKRNLISKQVADWFHFPYVDVWTPLIKAGYEYNDYIHMKADGNNFIAGYLSEILM